MNIQKKIYLFMTDCINYKTSVFNISKYFDLNEIKQMDLILRKLYSKQKKSLGLDLIKQKNKNSVIIPEDKIIINVQDPNNETYKYKTLIYYFEKIIDNYKFGSIKQDISEYIENELFNGEIKKIDLFIN